MRIMDEIVARNHPGTELDRGFIMYIHNLLDKYAKTYLLRS
jgi:hypothetical protein